MQRDVILQKVVKNTLEKYVCKAEVLIWCVCLTVYSLKYHLVLNDPYGSFNTKRYFKEYRNKKQ